MPLWISHRHADEDENPAVDIEQESNSKALSGASDRPWGRAPFNNGSRTSSTPYRTWR